MYCSKCGSALPENAMFCSSCGSKITTVPQQQVGDSEKNDPVVPVSNQQINEPDNNKVYELLSEAFADKWDWFPTESEKWMTEEFKKCNVNKANMILGFEYGNPKKIFRYALMIGIICVYLIVFTIVYSTKDFYAVTTLYTLFFLCAILFGLIYYLLLKIDKCVSLNNFVFRYLDKNEVRKSNFRIISKLLNTK